MRYGRSCQKTFNALIWDILLCVVAEFEPVSNNYVTETQYLIQTIH